MPVKITVHNESTNYPFTFDTRGNPVTEPSVTPIPEGLAEPRPAYDLLFVGQRGPDFHHLTRYVWVWSEQQVDPLPPTITLGPAETRVLFDLVWQPPPDRYLRGGFTVRFAFFDVGMGPSVHDGRAEE